MKIHLANHKKSIVLGSIAVILIALAALYGVAEANYQSGLNTKINDLEKSSSELSSQGVTVKDAPKVTHGETLFSSWSCVDTNCPRIESYWYVLTNRDAYGSFVSEAERLIKNNDTDWKVALYDGDISEEDYPFPAPEGKAWVGVRVFVYK